VWGFVSGNKGNASKHFIKQIEVSIQVGYILKSQNPQLTHYKESTTIQHDIGRLSDWHRVILRSLISQIRSNKNKWEAQVKDQYYKRRLETGSRTQTLRQTYYEHGFNSSETIEQASEYNKIQTPHQGS